MEFAKELYEDGMTDPKDISREMDWKEMSEATVKQMIETMKKKRRNRIVYIITGISVKEQMKRANEILVNDVIPREEKYQKSKLI